MKWYLLKNMYPKDGKDSIFSTSKPTKVPWAYYPLIIGMIAAMVIFFNSF